MYYIYKYKFIIDLNKIQIKKIPIIVSLTTSPKRINNIKIVIDQILNQTIPPDYIYLNLPKVFKRTGETFKDIPNFLIHPKIKIKFVEDIGPITKILPTLQDNLHDDTLVISIDDDIYYGNNMIEVLCKLHNKFPNTVINGSNMNIYIYTLSNLLNFLKINNIILYEDERFVEGFAAVAYPYKLFKDIKINMDLPKVCYFSDDFIISNYLDNKKIPIIKIHNNFIIPAYIIKALNFGFKYDALHKGGGVKIKESKNHDVHPDNYRECAIYYNNRGELAKELKSRVD